THPPVGVRDNLPGPYLNYQSRPSDQSRPLITVWLAVRVLPAPPRSPTLTEISRGLTNTRGFAGRRAGLQSLQGRRTASEAVRGLLSLQSKNRFPGAWEGAVRDSVRMRRRRGPAPIAAIEQLSGG